MASNMGDVYEIYTHSAEKPYRDNGAAITSIATLRSLDFGDASIRKAIGKVSVDYRTVSTTDSSDTKLLSSIDNKDQFEEADSATIKTTDTEEDGLGSTGDVKVRTIRYSIGRRKCAYFQLQFTNGVLDSPMEVSGINIRVAGLADRGIIQAKETQE
jgi:hypothetical protein